MMNSKLHAYRKPISLSEMEYLQLQLDALQDNKENEEHIKRILHDLKNRLVIIQTLCVQGNCEEIRKYADELNADAFSPPTTCTPATAPSPAPMRSSK